MVLEVLAGNCLEIGQKLIDHSPGTPLAGLGATIPRLLETKGGKESQSLRQ